MSPEVLSNSRRQRFLARASRQGHTRTLQPLSSPPRLLCRFPGPGPSVASPSRPEPHLSRTFKLTWAHNYPHTGPHTHNTDHRRRRHALPLHTCSNTTPPKHSPDQNGQGLPLGGPGSRWLATALGSSAAVSALATTARRRQALRSVWWTCCGQSRPSHAARTMTRHRARSARPWRRV